MQVGKDVDYKVGERCAAWWERVALRVGNRFVEEGCAAGRERMGLLGGRRVEDSSCAAK